MQDESKEGADSDAHISPEKVCFIIVKAREFDARTRCGPDPGSNPLMIKT
jgi:hypothetical protein